MASLAATSALAADSTSLLSPLADSFLGSFDSPSEYADRDSSNRP